MIFKQSLIFNNFFSVKLNSNIFLLLIFIYTPCFFFSSSVFHFGDSAFCEKL